MVLFVRSAPLIGENPECAVFSASIHMSPYLRRWRGSKSLIVIGGRHGIENPILAQEPRIGLERCPPRHLQIVCSLTSDWANGLLGQQESGVTLPAMAQENGGHTAPAGYPRLAHHTA